MKYNLTIGIPTFNGERTLETLLKSIVNSKTSFRYEVVISDNNSNDNTPIICKKYSKEYSFIKYYRNNENIGFDGNVNMLFQHSKDGFVWIIGDDDYIRNDSIQTIYENINKYEGKISYIYTNFSMFNNKVNKISTYRKTNILKDYYLDNFSDVTQIIKLDNSFVSSNIFNKSIWKKYYDKDMLNTQWIHYEMFLKTSIENQNYLILKNPLAVNNGDRPIEESNGNSNGKALLLIIELSKLVKKYEENNNIKKLESLKKDIALHLIKKINNSKRNNLKFTKKIFSEVRDICQNKLYFYTIILPLLILPAIIHKFIYRLYLMRYKIWSLVKK